MKRSLSLVSASLVGLAMQSVSDPAWSDQLSNFQSLGSPVEVRETISTPPPQSPTPKREKIPEAAIQLQQQFAGAFTTWVPPGTVSTAFFIQQQIWLPSFSMHSYAGMTWRWEDLSFGGRLGFEHTDGGMQRVVFTLEHSDWAQDASQSLCEAVLDELGQTTNWQCFRDLMLDPAKFYRLRLEGRGIDGEGAFWRAILDEGDGFGNVIGYNLGVIRVPFLVTDLSHKLIDPNSINNIVEYTGPAINRCQDVPPTAAGFTPPVLNNISYQTIDPALAMMLGVAGLAEGNTCVTGREQQGATASILPIDFGFPEGASEGALLFLGDKQQHHRLQKLKIAIPPSLPQDPIIIPSDDE